mgnify:CR=1 FL=1|jgi:hypothetical protein
MAKRKKTAVAKTPPKPTPEQIIQVKTWIVEGQQAGDILDSIAQNYPKQTPRVLLSMVFEDLTRESAEINEDLVRGFLLNAYRELYRRAFEINDFNTAISALRSFERVTLS